MQTIVMLAVSGALLLVSAGHALMQRYEPVPVRHNAYTVVRN